MTVSTFSRSFLAFLTLAICHSARAAAPEASWKGLHTVYECATMMTKGWTDEAHPDACIAGVFTNYLLGIEPVEPGYRRFRVRPQPTKTVTSAGGCVSTPYGTIRVAWHLENGKVALDVDAPKGTERVQ